ncbi:sensor domain-containing diguanylate cyclase [Zavarzinella formosa]|uniref:sensor domain-containing diguanylate cyclase n=1 Tax=Zavarzinella formosa TaxID=360055 RepID=UPI0002ED112B|nr:GGDEF domain-containing protein [Zavarzinella formosa]
MRERIRLFRLATAMTALTMTVVFVGLSLGLLPDSGTTAVIARKDYCEAVAVHAAREARDPDLAGLRETVKSAVERNPQLRSLGVRLTDGKLAAFAGDHEQEWVDPGDVPFTGRYVRVPISANGKPWGQLEFAFGPLPAGPFGLTPEVAFVIFVGVGCMLLYSLYVWHMSWRAGPTDLLPHRVRSALEALSEGVLVLDTRQQIALANGAFSRLVHIPTDQLRGKPIQELPWQMVNTNGPLVAADLPWERSLRKGLSQTGFLLSLLRDGQLIRLSINTTPILADDGKNCGTLVTCDDLTGLEQKNTELQDLLLKLQHSRAEIHHQNRELKLLATRDPLTLCMNRRSFMTELQTVWDRRLRGGSAASCVMVDVDFFKKINDNHGHSAGDQVLQQVAELLRGNSRNTDLVCRYGGEEFCIVLPNTDLTSAAMQAERIRAALAANPIAGIPVTASLGVSCTELSPATIQEFLDQADKALYAAKHGGRNRVVCFNEVPADSNSTEKPLTKPAPAPAQPILQNPVLPELIATFTPF